MKSLNLGLWQEVAKDLATLHSVSTNRDFETVTKRVEKEGMSFLTLTLPAFATDFERCLDIGRVDSDAFAGFKRSRGLPAFLSGFLRRIFHTQSGTILDDPCIDSVIAIRQLCCLFKKIEMECTPERTEQAYNAYIKCEDDLRKFDREWSSFDKADFSRVSSLLFGDVFDQINREIDEFKIRPRHGSGSTADRKMGNKKWMFTEWTDRLESVFPHVEYGLPNHRYWSASAVDHLPPARERPVKVIHVPKTMKTPRIIAMEPSYMQYLQLGLAERLKILLEETSPSKYFIGFSHQEPNQLMAREGSLDGSLATLDLSEASDRVSNNLVIEMLRPWPSLLEAVQATRSRVAVLPSGKKVRLAKFASMGSGLCFPIEAMVFTTIAFLGIQDTTHRLTPRDFVKFRGRVRVYGDDIIVPRDCAVSVVQRLESFGLKVNHKKSHWNGNFRESCGGDYFMGEWVTPLRLKSVPPTTKRDVFELQSWVEFSNSLHFAGYWNAARFVADHVSKILGPLPTVPRNVDALALKSFTDSISGNVGWDEALHRPKVKAYVATVVQPVNRIDGMAALHKTISGDWSDPMFREHLERSGRPSSAYAKRKWVLC